MEAQSSTDSRQTFVSMRWEESPACGGRWRGSGGCCEGFPLFHVEIIVGRVLACRRLRLWSTTGGSLSGPRFDADARISSCSAAEQHLYERYLSAKLLVNPGPQTHISALKSEIVQNNSDQ